MFHELKKDEKGESTIKYKKSLDELKASFKNETICDISTRE
jgi:hypothetical protein